VIAADSPGLRDSVRPGETGLLVRYQDEEALATALIRVLLDQPLRDRLAAAGAEWAGRFQWPECARQSLDALLEGAGVPR
jgi:glycosyltransferase involved in cell wall biosynthesis